MIQFIILLITVGVAFIDDTTATTGTNDPIKVWSIRFDCFHNIKTNWYFEIISFNFKLVNNGFEEFIGDAKETCDNKFKIGESTLNEGEDACRERCRSDPDCNYYFYTFKETCDNKEWCVLYKDCSEKRFPHCNGRTFRKTGTPI